MQLMGELYQCLKFWPLALKKIQILLDLMMNLFQQQIIMVHFSQHEVITLKESNRDEGQQAATAQPSILKGSMFGKSMHEV